MLYVSLSDEVLYGVVNFEAPYGMTYVNKENKIRVLYYEDSKGVSDDVKWFTKEEAEGIKTAMKEKFEVMSAAKICALFNRSANFVEEFHKIKDRPDQEYIDKVRKEPELTGSFSYDCEANEENGILSIKLKRKHN